MITQKQLKDFLFLDEKTGLFYWINDAKFRKQKGTLAGCFDSNGYRVIAVNKKRYYSHRLVWLYINGRFPLLQIDHIDGNRSNNLASNLREVTIPENIQNQKKANKSNFSSGLLGCYFNKNEQKFRANIQVNKKSIHLGYFDTATLAHNAYVKAKRELHATCML